MDCMKSCTGMYADIQCSNDMTVIKDRKLMKLRDKYIKYKTRFAENVVFDMDTPNGSRLPSTILLYTPSSLLAQQSADGTD